MPIAVTKSWLLYIAVGFTLVAVGAIIDFFLKKDEVRRLHARFLRWANLLSHTRIREWQVLIAKTGHNMIHAITENTSHVIFQMLKALVLKCFAIFRGNIILTVVTGTLSICSIIFAYIYVDWWVWGSIVLPFLVFAACGIVDYTPLKVTVSQASALSGLATISVILSLCSTLITLYGIPDCFLHTHWYVLQQGGIKPTYPLLLPTVNFPFDLATVAVTVKLLAYVKKRRSLFLPVALLDIFLSLVFSILLYASLLMIEAGWDYSHFGQHLTSAVAWFGGIFGFAGSLLTKSGPIDLTGVKDLHLLPILLTTFVPVALYMGAFIFLSFCKPVMWMASRFFGAIGEREESVFKQFATLLAVILAAAKAFYDYFAVI